MSLKNLLTSELKQLYPDMKDYLVDRYVNKYISAVLAEIKQALLRPSNDNDELSFNSTRAHDACGQIKFNGQTILLFTFMDRNEKTRLVIEKFAGQLGKYKRVVLNELYKDQIMYELLDTPAVGMTSKEQKELEENYNVIIPVDSASLASYIEKTREMIGITPKGPLLDLLHACYARATELYAHIQEHDGIQFLKEYWITADSGRTYGKFNSLQRMQKEVRHAALGACHKYDFQAHSFAVMASIAKKIDPTIKIAAIEEYIRYRTVIRQRIANEVGVSESVIKTVFTSLGFGAKPVANPFMAIRRAVYSDQAFNQLVNNDTFKFINEDLQLINATVLAHYGNDNFVGMNGFEFKSRDAKTNRRKNDSTRLAWIYQNAESAITKLFTEIVEQCTGQRPLMTVHDCVYYKQRIPTATFLDVQSILRIDNELQFVKLEHEEIWPIGTQEQYDNRFADYDRAEDNHKQFIQHQEQQAKEYARQFQQRQIDPTLSTHNPVDMYMNRQLDHDLPDYEYEYEYEYDEKEMK